MRKYYAGPAALIILVMALAGCAAGISEQARSKVTYAGTFRALQKDTGRYQGQTVMLGGKILQTQAMEGATEIVVLQLELNSSDRPQDNDQSQGRFIIRSSGFLDPAIYPPGALITVVGTVQTNEVRPIGQMAYRYPVIKLVEIKKWPAAGQTSPSFHFGFGVGTSF